MSSGPFALVLYSVAYTSVIFYKVLEQRGHVYVVGLYILLIDSVPQDVNMEIYIRILTEHKVNLKGPGWVVVVFVV